MMSSLLVIAVQAVLAAAPTVGVEVPVAGGAAAAAEAIGIPTVPDRARFVAEIARAVYADSASGAGEESRRYRLRAHLMRAGATPGAAVDLVPVPLTPAVWSRAVFHRPLPAGELFAAVILDRNAALLAHGLAALDDETLRFLADHPAVLERIYRHDASTFASFAEHLQVHDNHVLAPGGDRAAELWEALIDERLDRPEEFVPRLFAKDGGRTAYLYDTMADLDHDRAAFALGLWIDAADLRRDRFKALAAAANAVYPQWNPRQHLFRRPPHDLLSMLWRLRPSTDGRLAFPAWREVLFPAPEGRTTAANPTPIDAAALALATLHGDVPSRGAQLDQLAFGERVFAAVDAAATPDATAALAAFPRYPTLMLTVERAGIRRPALYAALARHADRLSRIQGSEAPVALAQFQGALAVVARLARVRSIPQPAVERLAETLSAVRLGPNGYAGALAEWVRDDVLRALPPGGDADAVLLSALAGRPPAAIRSSAIIWEEHEYWFDPVASEARRLRRIRERLDAPTVDVALSQLAALYDTAFTRNTTDAALLSRVDAPLGEALLALAYAVALGNADGSARFARHLARRHDFGAHGKDPDARARAAWALPRQHFGSASPWHVDGAALALDVALAPLALQRIGTKPPSRTPALDSIQRDVWTVGAALVDPLELDDRTLDAIAASVARGRQRVADLACGGEDPETIAREIDMDGARVRAMRWARAHDAAAVGSFFSTIELFTLGGGTSDLRPWGVSALNFTGSLSTDVSPVHRTTALAGRPLLGLISIAAADLNLRVALVLRDLGLPAGLAPSLLAFAVRDFIDEVQPNDLDDWLTLVRAAQAVSRERIEDYVAAATSGGALVAAAPITDVHIR